MLFRSDEHFSIDHRGNLRHRKPMLRQRASAGFPDRCEIGISAVEEGILGATRCVADFALCGGESRGELVDVIAVEDRGVVRQGYGLTETSPVTHCVPLPPAPQKPGSAGRAGIFAATMSTADSLILSCSAALTHDLLPHRVEKIRLLKGATVLVTVLALLWALTNSQSVFNLVIMAWSGLASAFAPLLLVLALGQRLEQRTAITMMFTGIATALCWRWVGWQGAVYEGLPGMLAGLSVFMLFEKILPAGEAAAETVVEE